MIIDGMGDAWLAVLQVVGVLPGLLDLTGPFATNAIFAMTANSLDLSYVIPITLRCIFQFKRSILHGWYHQTQSYIRYTTG